MQNVNEYLNKILSKNDTIVVACSGGPDSMFLLYTLICLKKDYNLSIICAHVNHNVRKESDAEAIFVQNYCKDHDVVFEYKKITEPIEDNFHNGSRTIRYEFFYDLVRKYDAKYLMTAHHGDDLVETILMRLTRGTTLIGYSGFNKMIRKENFIIVRPLVYLTKKQIEDYDIENDIPFVTDLSNTKPKYTRNRYRLTVLPFLKQEDANIHLKYLKYSEKIEECCDFINNITKKEMDKVYKDGNLDINKFNKIDIFIQKSIIERILSSIYNDDLFYITDKHVELIISLIKSEKTNAKINLPNNIVVKKRYDKCVFGKENEDSTNYCYEFKDYILINNKYEINRIEVTDDNSNNCLKLNSSEIKLPLIIRNRRESDTIEIKNLKGHKKIKDIFIDEKIDIEERNAIPLVTDNDNNILWIPGIKKSKYDKSFTEKYDIILKYIKKEEN